MIEDQETNQHFIFLRYKHRTTTSQLTRNKKEENILL